MRAKHEAAAIRWSAQSILQHRRVRPSGLQGSFSPPHVSPADATLPHTTIEASLACVNNITLPLEIFFVPSRLPQKRRDPSFNGGRIDYTFRSDTRQAQVAADKGVNGSRSAQIAVAYRLAAIGQLHRYLWLSDQIASPHSALSGTTVWFSGPVLGEDKPLDRRGAMSMRARPRVSPR